MRRRLTKRCPRHMKTFGGVFVIFVSPFVKTPHSQWLVNCQAVGRTAVMSLHVTRPHLRFSQRPPPATWGLNYRSLPRNMYSDRTKLDILVREMFADSGRWFCVKEWDETFRYVSHVFRTSRCHSISLCLYFVHLQLCDT